MRWFLLSLLLLAHADRPSLAAGGGGTATITGKVELRHDGKSKEDASGVVVYVVGFDEQPSTDVPQVMQKGKRFHPDLLAITAGQEVAFPNGDNFFHNVFSPSSTRKFDLGQYKQGESKSKSFPKPGVVEVYCNIHPEMAATILVLPNRRYAITGADGSFTIEGVPAGNWTVYAYSRLAAKPVARKAKVSAGASATLAFSVDETRDDFEHKNKYGEKYKDPGKYR
jgi:plastocyanin